MKSKVKMVMSAVDRYKKLQNTIRRKSTVDSISSEKKEIKTISTRLSEHSYRGGVLHTVVHQLSSAAIGTAFDRALTQPLDTITTRSVKDNEFVVKYAYRNATIPSTLSEIKASVSSLYSGIIPAWLRGVLARTTGYVVQDRVMKRLVPDTEAASLRECVEEGAKSGAASAVAETVVSWPLELAKILKQIEVPNEILGVKKQAAIAAIKSKTSPAQVAALFLEYLSWDTSFYALEKALEKTYGKSEDKKEVLYGFLAGFSVTAVTAPFAVARIHTMIDPKILMKQLPSLVLKSCTKTSFGTIALTQGFALGLVGAIRGLIGSSAGAE